MSLKRFRNRTRQKITMQVKNWPWRSFLVTFWGALLLGLSTHFLPFI